MANQYGIADLSMLSGPAQNTARQVQQAFDNSFAANRRAMARYSLPALSNASEDSALAQAQTAAGLINQNQQQQNAIDASHATPHGVAANIAAYAPYLGLGAQIAPYLLGTNTTSGIMRNGLIPSAYNAVKSWFDPNTGTTYHFDQNGNIVDGPMAGTQANEAGWPGDTTPTNYGTDFTAPATDWTTGFGGDFTAPATDWTAGFGADFGG